jgi:hypothetical protein
VSEKGGGVGGNLLLLLPLGLLVVVLGVYFIWKRKKAPMAPVEVKPKP